MTRLQVAIIAVLMASTPLVTTGQQKQPTWTPPRTSWGEPDLQGQWTNETLTPFERD